jgi:formylglycine-generating enzyme required for sulfatase activity
MGASFDLFAVLGGPLVIFAAAAVACSDTAAARTQLLVYVDTDAHVSSELLARTDLSEDATVDTLRVDLLDGSGQTNTFFVADSASWPVSFGVLPSTSPPLLMRVRLFRALFATAGTANGGAVLDPPPEVAIDRVVSLSWPDSGVQNVRVVLAADCLGEPSSFLTPLSTCVDAARRSVSTTVGVDYVTGPPQASSVGTWAPAVDVPCMSQPVSGRVCIPGGFDIMGEATEVGLTIPSLDPLPYRPVLVSPFFLDTLEVTVGRLRQLVLAGRYTGSLPGVAMADNLGSQFCTWVGKDSDAADAFPVNCVDQAWAESMCEAFGGSLPTEAQWNHASRGRGQRREFPWGDSDPECCTESASRTGFPGSCGTGPQPAGSHPPSACNGVGDVSRDGVIDMGGSMAEAVLDDIEPYAGACWMGKNILVDPRCRVKDSIGTIAKGGDWLDGPGDSAAALRFFYQSGFQYGFRCAYPDGSP